jgi:outer membrane protein OmpA-like peptidoglycan-associated protein
VIRRSVPAGVVPALVVPLLVVPLIAIGAGTAQAATTPTPPTTAQIAASVESYSIDGSVDVYTVDGSVDTLAATSTSATGTTLTLGTDVFFDFGSAHLDPTAGQALTGKLGQIPKRAKVSVTGYTDAIGSSASNLTLSKKRAKAVAGAIAKARPDLRLSTSGRGESAPVAPNTLGGQDNPEGRAQNRRVELNWPK